MQHTVFFENRQRAVKLPGGIRALLRCCVAETLKREGVNAPAEVSISFVSDEEIAALNTEYRGKPVATDVLSFPMGEDGEYEKNLETGAILLGDIVISAKAAVRQAEQYGHSAEREFAFLTVHSMLHLLGYDHENSKTEDEEMQQKQENILLALRLKRG